MYKFINIIMFLIIIIFIYKVSVYFSSSKNLNIKKNNRNNIEQILNEKISDLPVLLSDTNNVIEFNDSFNNEIDDDKKRNFWELFKN